MSTLKTLSLATALAVAVSLSGPLLAQTHAHDHGAPAKLALNKGQKWSTDEPLRDGIGRIRALVAPPLQAQGKLTAAQYAELAQRVEAEVGGIVANCKLAPDADAMLHLVIADLGAGIDAMSGKAARQRPADGLHQVALALNQYGRYFDDRGYKPLHVAH